MYNYVFGPVPSRRLGMSLGIDLVPHKVCSLNCIYCECGQTTRLTLERGEYVPVGEVLEEISHFFAHHPDPDTLTFSGSGEPTLHSGIGNVIDFLKQIRPAVKVAVLTNGTLFSDPDVRRGILRADLVLPSLDAATEKAFRKINRPPGKLRVKDYVRGLVEFREEYSGSLWLEVFILPGYNDDAVNLNALKEAIGSIRPDRVQLNTLDRPGTVAWLRPATRAELEEIARMWNFQNLEIIVSAAESSAKPGSNVVPGQADRERSILETITRRPCTAGDIRKILGISLKEVNELLGRLVSEGKIETSEQERGLFYQVRNS